MPIFEYKCSCGNEKEVICKHQERLDAIRCEKCNDPFSMELVPSFGSFVMTGYRASNGYSVSEDIQNRK